MWLAVSFAVLGGLLLLLGGVGLAYHVSAKNIHAVYMSLFSGTLFVGIAILITISRLRYYGNLRGSTGTGSSDGLYADGSGQDFSHGHGGDCGHAESGDAGGCGGDGGGGH
jgi:hypothetical protein